MTTAQWVNAGPDDAALPALLERIAQRIPVESIDELWIFPTRRGQGVESTVIVVSTFHDASSERVELRSASDADPQDRNASPRQRPTERAPEAAGQRDRRLLGPALAGRGRKRAAADAGQGDRRRVSTAHFTASRDRKGRATVEETIELHAIAPAGAVGRAVEGVIRRLDDGLALPRSERIGGDPARWTALLETVNPAAAPDPARQRAG